MNHLCALQRSDGRWDYTRNRRPTGYCCEYKPIPEDCGWLPPEAVRLHNMKMGPLKEKFHADGHATEAEACECHKQYLLDTELRLMTQEPANANQQSRCEVCKTFTACYAMVGAYRLITLCPQHQTREHVAELLRVGKSWES